MASFPTIKSGTAVAMNGTATGRRVGVGVVEFENSSEQRWRTVRPLFEGTLVFSNVNGRDLALIVAFVRSMKGQLDKTWDITIAGSTWSYMTFVQDNALYQEIKPGRYSITLKCRQTRKN